MISFRMVGYDIWLIHIFQATRALATASSPNSLFSASGLTPADATLIGTSLLPHLDNPPPQHEQASSLQTPVPFAEPHLHF